MQCTSDGHCSMLHVPCHFVSFFPFENRVPKYRKKTRQIYLWTTCKSLENLLFHQFSVLVISRKWYKDWKMSLYKHGQARACFCWITEIPDQSTRVFFSRWSFLCGFFQRCKFCHINFVHILHFFSMKFEHIWNYCGIIGIKIQISIACLEKNFSVKMCIK